MGEIVTARTARKEGAALQRFSLTLPPMQNEALNNMARETGLPKNDLIRHAIALLNLSLSAKKKGLQLALVNEDMELVGQVVSTV